MSTLTASPIESVLSVEQRASVLQELTDVLNSPHFSGSRRCSQFLGFVVRQAVDGNVEQLTERFLGAELFNRPLDYETATDAIVRVKALEVRRRLSSHNLETLSANGVRIQLSSGSYVPEFGWLAPAVLEPQAQQNPAVEPEHAPQQPSAAAGENAHHAEVRHFRWLGWYGIPAILLLIAAIGSFFWVRNHRSHERALNVFWKPVFSAEDAVNVRFGDGIGSTYWISPELMRKLTTHKSLNITADQIVQNEGSQASSGNFLAALSITSLLERHGVPTQVQWPQDFLNASGEPRSVVYIGAFSNPWTLELNRHLRFAFEPRQIGTVSVNSIVDHAVPHRQWPSADSYAEHEAKDVLLHRDYALITRVFDEDHRHVIIAAGGMSQYGTQGAGEFLADPVAWDQFARTAPVGWEHKNLQIVLEMGVARGRILNPRIIATNIW